MNAFIEAIQGIWNIRGAFMEGAWVTLKLFFFTMLLSIPAGLPVALGSNSKIAPIRWICKAFVWIFRGTPLMLQLIVIFYGPGLIGAWAEDFIRNNVDFLLENLEIARVVIWVSKWTSFDRFTAVIVAFVINYSCYFSEIYRGGIESISKGQYEAGQVLGMTRRQTFFRVVLLQVIKRIIPPMSNEIITLVKDTSLARTISVYEIIWAGQAFIKSDGLLWPLFYTGAFYLVFCGVLTVLFGKLEKKLNYFKS